MGCIISGALLFTGPERIKEILPVPVDLAGIAPFLLAGTFCMMTTAATSVSMEGKNWWLVKSLPLPTKTILDAKILMNLILVLPFYLLSEVFLILALRPGMQKGFWLGSDSGGDPFVCQYIRDYHKPAFPGYGLGE